VTRLARISPDRTVREEAAILARLGFRYLGSNAGGHHLFEHPRYGALRPMSSTPRNPRTWRTAHRREVAALMGLNLFQLNRLIAGQPLQQRPRSRRSRRLRRGVQRSVVALMHRPADAKPAPVVENAPVPVPSRTSCIDCGRLWLSDLNPSGRPCPACGGRVVLGKEAA